MVGMAEVDGTGVKPPLLGLDIACFAARTGRELKNSASNFVGKRSIGLRFLVRSCLNGMTYHTMQYN